MLLSVSSIFRKIALPSLFSSFSHLTTLCSGRRGRHPNLLTGSSAVRLRRILDSATEGQWTESRDIWEGSFSEGHNERGDSREHPV